MSWRQRRILPLSDTEEGPRDDHDPPLGWRYVATYHTIDSDGNSKTGSITCDCSLPFDGSDLVLCEEHRDE